MTDRIVGTLKGVSTAESAAFAESVRPPWPPKNLGEAIAWAVDAEYIYNWWTVQYAAHGDDYARLFAKDAA